MSNLLGTQPLPPCRRVLAVQPTSIKDPPLTYTEDTLVKFKCPLNPGMALKPGSIYLKGQAQVLQNGEPVVGGIYHHYQIGAHCLFSQVNDGINMQEYATNSQGNYYPTFVQAMTENGSNLISLFAESNANMELRCDNVETAESIWQGQAVGDTWIDFMMSPVIPLNLSNAPIPQRLMQNGGFTVNFRINTAQRAFQGWNNDSDTTFALQSLYLYYEEMPEPVGKNGKPLINSVIMNSFECLPLTMKSNHLSINTSAPNAVYGAVALFLPTSDATSYTASKYRTAVLPGVFQDEGIRVEWAFNGRDNEKITYPIDNVEETLYQYRLAFGRTMSDDSSILLSNLHKPVDINSGFGIGLNFGQIWNLVQGRFALDLYTLPNGQGVTSDAPYECYLYFLTQLVLGEAVEA